MLKGKVRIYQTAAATAIYNFNFLTNASPLTHKPLSLSPVAVPSHPILSPVHPLLPSETPPTVFCALFLPFPQGLLKKRSCLQCSVNLPIAFLKNTAVVD